MFHYLHFKKILVFTYSCRRTGVSRVNFVEESKITLARLMLKHVKLLKPDLVPVERARRDLEMWVRVVKEFHSFGYTNTLEEIQSTWSKMKIKANLARKVTGPMMYLDYLVYSYIIGDSVTGDGIIESEGMSNNYCDLTESTTASFSDNSIQTENYENLSNSSNRHINTVKVQRPTNGLSKGDDCDIISIDDDVMVLESVSNSTNKHSENNSDKNVNSAIINNSNVNNKRDGDAGGTGQTMKALLSFRHNK